jgi:hypothetical protein
MTETPSRLSPQPTPRRKPTGPLIGSALGALLFLVVEGLAYSARTTVGIIGILPGMLVIMVTSSWGIWDDPRFGELLGMCTIFGVSAIPFALAGALLAARERSSKILALVLVISYLVILTACGLILVLMEGSGFDT